MQTNAEYHREWRKKNPEKARAAVARYRKKNPENEWNGHLKRKYGINLEQYNVLLVEQDNSCAICKNVQVGRRLDVDHDHETGKVRGLLCINCNAGIGNLKDDIDILRAAIDYLERGDANV